MRADLRNDRGAEPGADAGADAAAQAGADIGAGLPFWLDDIHDFLARLRGAPWRIGVGEEARVLWLLEQLRHCDGAPQSAEALAQWLGPVCCTNPHQQARFAAELEQWALEHGAAAATTPAAGSGFVTSAVAARAASVPAPVAAVQRVAVISRWLLGVGFAALLGVIGLAVWWLPQLPAPVAQAPAPAASPIRLTLDAERIAGLAGPALPLLGLVAYLLWQRQRPQALARRFVAAATPRRAVSLKAARRLLFAPGSLSPHFQALRRHHELPSNRLDVARSLHATLRAGGAVQLQFATQRRLPDYLVLIDRVSVADHEGALADVVLRRFSAEQVPYSAYDFHGDPRRARAIGTGVVADLADLAALHGAHPLILFTEAERFFVDDAEQAPEQTQAWVDQLLTWPMTVILTPKPRAEWAARERRLQALGFIVLPATPAGIAGFAALLNAGAAEPIGGTADAAHAGAATAADLPLDLLRVRPDRWVRQTAPAPDEIDALVQALQAGLGARGFELLGAIAVFPAVHAEVTLWLADALSRGDVPGLDEDLFGRLARLPWLRRGRLPDWLRLALIERLAPAREAEIRRLCLRLLRPLEADPKAGPRADPSTDPSAGAGAARAAGFELEIATGSQRTWLATLLAAVRQDEHSSLRDTVFLGFVRGDLARRKALDPLALRTPDELNRLLRPPRFGVLEWQGVALTVLATALLWRYDAALGALAARAWEALVPRVNFGVGVQLALRMGAATGIAATLTLWHGAVLNAAPELRLNWRRGARVTAPAAAFAAALALPGTAGLEGPALLIAASAALLLTWLPPRPGTPTTATAPVQLAALTRSGSWVRTSVGGAFWLALFFIGYGELWKWLMGSSGLSGLGADAAQDVAYPAPGRDASPPWGAAVGIGGAHLFAALALGRRLALPVGVALRCGVGSVLAAGFVLALMVASGGGPAPPPYADSLFGVALLVAAAWGALLVLWRAGRAPPAALPAMAALAGTAAATVVVAWVVVQASRATPLSTALGASLLPLLDALFVSGIFAVSLWRRGLVKDRPGQWMVWQDGRLVAVSAPRLRLLLGGGVLLLAPLAGLLATATPTTPPMSEGQTWALAPFNALVLLLPALRIAAPELFNPFTLPLGPALVPGAARRGLAWACVPLLWLLTLSYDFGFGRFPQAIELFVPLAAWWAARYGRAGWAPFVIGASPLLIWFGAGPVFIGGGAGIFLVAVIVYRLVAEPAYRDATFNAAHIGTRQLLYLLLVAPLVVHVPGTDPMHLGGGLQPYFALLLLLLGMADLRPRALPWALALGLLFGLALRLAPVRSGDFLSGAIWVNYGLSDPSALVGALLALYAPVWLWRRRERVMASTVAVQARWSPVYWLLGVGFIDVYFGVAFDFAAIGFGPSNRLSVSLLGTPGLLVLAFLIGLFEGPPGRWRTGALLTLLGLVAIGINVIAGTPTASGALGVLRYGVEALDVVQGALVVMGYVWLGGQVGARGGASIALGRPAVTAVVPATLPQLRFASMDIALMAGAAVLLALRATSALGYL